LNKSKHQITLAIVLAGINIKSVIPKLVSAKLKCPINPCKKNYATIWSRDSKYFVLICDYSYRASNDHVCLKFWFNHNDVGFYILE
jgi:hypothetical protein